MMFEQGELIIYQSEDGRAAVVSKHLRNIFQSGELVKAATVAKNATVQQEGSREVSRMVEWFNFDAIISVGCRVNSKRGTQFRIWATSVLKDHLVQGYTLNQKRLAEKGFGEARQMLELLTNTLESHSLVGNEGRAGWSTVCYSTDFWRTGFVSGRRNQGRSFVVFHHKRPPFCGC
jgi:hypothetical protein